MESDFKSENVCRVCLSSGEEMQDLFVKDSILVEQIEYCTGLLLLPAPSLPTLICQPCLAHLRTAHFFKTTCLASHNSLHSHTLTDPHISLDKSSKTNIPLTISCMIPILPVTVKVEREEQDDMDAGGDEMGDVIDDELGDEWVATVRKSKRVKMKKKREDSPGATKARALKRGPCKRRARPAAPRESVARGPRLTSDCQDEGQEDKQGTETWLSEAAPRQPCRARRAACAGCALQFSSRVELAAHRARAHPAPPPPRPRPHKEPKLWICEFCGKTFTHQSSHYTHVRSHMPPLHACPHCHYRTWHRHDLTKHLRIHNGEKNFQCAVCPKSFYNSSNLLSHTRRTHERSRPHACAQCPKRFYDRTKLRRHQDSHDAIKRFECEVCHSCFTRRCYWKKHLQKQHGVVIPPAKSGRQKLNFIVGEDLMESKKDWPALLQGSEKAATALPSTAEGTSQQPDPKDAIS